MEKLIGRTMQCKGREEWWWWWGQAGDCDLIGNICGGRRRQQWQRWRSYAGIDTGGRMIGAKRWRMPPLQSDQGIITHYPSSPGQEMLPSPGQRRTCCSSYLQHPTSEPRPSIQPGHGGICCQTCKLCLTMLDSVWQWFIIIKEGALVRTLRIFVWIVGKGIAIADKCPKFR